MTDIEHIIAQLQGMLRELDECGEMIAAIRIAEAIEILTHSREGMQDAGDPGKRD